MKDANILKSSESVSINESKQAQIKALKYQIKV